VTSGFLLLEDLASPHVPMAMSPMLCFFHAFVSDFYVVYELHLNHSYTILEKFVKT